MSFNLHIALGGKKKACFLVVALFKFGLRVQLEQLETFHACVN